MPGATRAAVVTQSGIGVSVDAGLPLEQFMVPDGEEAKSLSAVESLCHGFARAGLSRSDVVIAVGYRVNSFQATQFRIWATTTLREFIVKVHSRCDLSCDYCYMYEMADQSWRSRPRHPLFPRRPLRPRRP